MPGIKAKPLRLIDILNTIDQDEYISIIIDNGKSEYWNTVRAAEIDFKKWLSTEVKRTAARGGNVRIFI